MKKLLKSMLLVVGALVLCGSGFADEISFWTTETQPDRIKIQEDIAQKFKEKTGHTVKIVPVEEKDMHTRASAAFAASDLPDIIYHTIPNLLPWADAGILDIDTASDIVEDLDPNTFAAGVLNMSDVDGSYASVPVDGGSQMLVYRKDLFEKNGLKTPDTFENIYAAIKKLNNPPQMYGFVAPTKIDEGYMMQVIEHLCLANGYSPINDDGTVNEDRKEIQEVLKLYKAMFDASPKGELYWKQSREQYLAGKAAMVLWSGAILDELGGLRDSAPVTINDDPTTKELAKNSGFVTSISGPSNAEGSAYVLGRYFGITTDANTDVAAEFAEFVLNEQYGNLLKMSPENKVPVRSGTPEDMDKFVKVWASLPVGVDRKAPMSDLYSQDVINRVRDGLVTGQRWGASNGQLTNASNIINARVMSKIFREYAEDEITLDEATDQIISQVSDLL